MKNLYIKHHLNYVRDKETSHNFQVFSSTGVFQALVHDVMYELLFFHVF